MKKRTLLSCLICCCVFNFTFAAGAKEIYVSKTNGSDFNNGSQSSPYQSLETAVSKVTDNTETKIFLEENVVFDIILPLDFGTNKKVEIIGKNTTIRAAEKGAFEGGEGCRILRAVAGSDMKVSGITFLNGRQVEYILGGAIFFAGNTLEIDNCRFINNQAGSAGGAIGARGKQVIVKNSYFEGNNIDGGGGYGAAIMQAGQKSTLDACSLVVQNCTFYKNFMPNGGQGPAIGIYDPSSTSVGGSFVNLSYMEISNCTFVENSTADAYQAAIDLSHSAASVQDCYIVNNTFYKNDGAFRFFYNEQPFYFINNVVFANKAAILNEMKVSEGREPLVAYNNILVGEERGINEKIDDISLTTQATQYNNVIKKASELSFNALGLSSTLSTDAVPYLAILSASSPLVDAGLDNSESITGGKNYVPVYDVRGYGINNKKDIGAYEYEGLNSIINGETEGLFYSLSISKDFVTIKNTEANSISLRVIGLDGKVIMSTTIENEITIKTAELGNGIAVFTLNNGSATKSFKVIL